MIYLLQGEFDLYEAIEYMAINNHFRGYTDIDTFKESVMDILDDNFYSEYEGAYTLIDTDKKIVKFVEVIYLIDINEVVG
jgi:hypothetical protein